MKRKIKNITSRSIKVKYKNKVIKEQKDTKIVKIIK